MVYVAERAGWRRRGEILRNLNEPARAGVQSLDLTLPARFVQSGPGGAQVTVELREEKQETTYLDAIALEVDGLRYPPRDCAADLPHCHADGVHHLLRPGERLRLQFDLAATRPGAAVRLWARGYYVPAP